MNIIALITTLKKIIFYKISNTKRYSELLFNTILLRPKFILEIGVYTGRRSLEMINASRIFNKEVSFFGFDLFESITEEKIKKELSKKPENKKKIYNKLKKFSTKVKLIKGNTLSTLRKFKAKKKIDLIFIDGGHSIKTIENDWKYSIKLLNRNGLIVFDDYYVGDKNIIKKFGCNQTINKIKKKYSVKFSKQTDYFKGKKYGIKLVFVKNLRSA